MDAKNTFPTVSDPGDDKLLQTLPGELGASQIDRRRVKGKKEDARNLNCSEKSKASQCNQRIKIPSNKSDTMIEFENELGLGQYGGNVSIIQEINILDHGQSVNQEGSSHIGEENLENVQLQKRKRRAQTKDLKLREGNQKHGSLWSYMTNGPAKYKDVSPNDEDKIDACPVEKHASNESKTKLSRCETNSIQTDLRVILKENRSGGGLDSAINTKQDLESQVSVPATNQELKKKHPQKLGTCKIGTLISAQNSNLESLNDCLEKGDIQKEGSSKIYTSERIPIKLEETPLDASASHKGQKLNKLDQNDVLERKEDYTVGNICIKQKARKVVKNIPHEYFVPSSKKCEVQKQMSPISCEDSMKALEMPSRGRGEYLTRSKSKRQTLTANIEAQQSAGPFDEADLKKNEHSKNASNQGQQSVLIKTQVLTSIECLKTGPDSDFFVPISKKRKQSPIEQNQTSTNAAKDGLTENDSGGNGIASFRIDLWGEAKLAAVENAQLGAGKQKHPFFSQLKSGQMQSSASGSIDIEKSIPQQTTRSSDVEAMLPSPPFHVVQTPDSPSFKCDWRGWKFLNTEIARSAERSKVIEKDLDSFPRESFRLMKLEVPQSQQEWFSKECKVVGKTNASVLDQLFEYLKEYAVGVEAGKHGNLERKIHTNLSLEHLKHRYNSEYVSRAKEHMQVSNSFPVNEGDDFNSSKHLLWADFYQPRSAKEVCGNKDGVNFLNNWLKRWKVNTILEESLEENGPNVKHNFARNSYRSWFEDDLEPENCFNDDDAIQNVLVLTGPIGCGKSAAVLACAREQGYTVIEVSASDHRSGTLVKQKFGEAMESHRLGKWSGSGASPLKATPCTESCGQAEMLEVPNVDKSSRDQQAGECSSKDMTLMLFEDVDLVFEEDRGFMSALLQLAETAKRPIVLTSNYKDTQLPCVLDKLSLNFEPPSLEDLMPHLFMICAAEQVPCTIYLIEQAIKACHHDLRKLLTFFQFWGKGKILSNVNEQSNFLEAFPVERANDATCMPDDARILSRIRPPNSSNITSEQLFEADAQHLVLPILLPLSFPCKLAQNIADILQKEVVKVERQTSFMAGKSAQQVADKITASIKKLRRSRRDKRDSPLATDNTENIIDGTNLPESFCLEEAVASVSPIKSLKEVKAVARSPVLRQKVRRKLIGMMYDSEDGKIDADSVQLEGEFLNPSEEHQLVDAENVSLTIDKSNSVNRRAITSSPLIEPHQCSDSELDDMVHDFLDKKKTFRRLKRMSCGSFETNHSLEHNISVLNLKDAHIGSKRDTCLDRSQLPQTESLQLGEVTSDVKGFNEDLQTLHPMKGKLDFDISHGETSCILNGKIQEEYHNILNSTCETEDEGLAKDNPCKEASQALQISNESTVIASQYLKISNDSSKIDKITLNSSDDIHEKSTVNQMENVMLASETLITTGEDNAAVNCHEPTLNSEANMGETTHNFWSNLRLSRNEYTCMMDPNISDTSKILSFLSALADNISICDLISKFHKSDLTADYDGQDILLVSEKIGSLEAAAEIANVSFQLCIKQFLLIFPRLFQTENSVSAEQIMLALNDPFTLGKSLTLGKVINSESCLGSHTGSSCHEQDIRRLETKLALICALSCQSQPKAYRAVMSNCFHEYVSYLERICHLEASRQASASSRRRGRGFNHYLSTGSWMLSEEGIATLQQLGQFGNDKIA